MYSKSIGTILESLHDTRDYVGVSESVSLIKSIVDKDVKTLSKCSIKGDTNFGKHSKYYLNVMRGVNKGDFSELHFSNGTYVKAYVSDKSIMLLLSHLVDISPKSHYMSNSFIRYEFDSKETALSCFKELESGKYSSVDDALNTTYDIIMTYNGKDVERHVGTESGKASASAGARVVSALQSVFDEWVNTEYGKSVENLPVLHDCYVEGDVEYISKHKIPLLDVYVTYYMEDKTTVDGFIHIFGSRLNGYYKVDKDSVVITLPSGIK